MITFESKNNSSAAYDGDIFFKAYATKRYYYIDLNTLQALTLPKRDLEPEELPEMDALIKAKLGSNFRAAIIK